MEDALISQCYKSLQFATRTALECQRLDLDPEIREVRTGIRKTFGELEHLLSTLRFIRNRDVADIAGNPRRNSFQGININGENNLIKETLEFFNLFASERDKNLQHDLRRLGEGFTNLANEVGQVETEEADEETDGNHLPQGQYESEKQKDLNYVNEVYESLPSSIWEMWSWRLKPYDRGYLYNSVTRRTLARNFFTRRVKG